MPKYPKESFDQILTQVEQGNLAPIYLLYGEDYLIKSALAQLSERLIPESQRSTNLQVVEGNQADFKEILDSLNTFALFAGRKAVVVQDCRIFYSRGNLPGLVGKSKEAYEANNLETAVRLILEVIGYAGWSLDDVAGGAWREIPADLWQQTMGIGQDETEMTWLEEVVAHAKNSNMEVVERGDDAALVEAALTRGFPPGQCLLVTTDTVDRRRSLYRLMEDKGVVVDFSVPSGTGRQARSQQEGVLKNLVRETLSKAGKTIEPTALSLLLERTGFNLWGLKTQLEKLISFLGDDRRITQEHVAGMTSHFKEEALYELNNAVTSRDCEASLVALHRLLGQDYHSLQLLGSLANEARRLLMAREFIEEHLAGGLDPKISYGGFQKQIVPLVKEKLGKDSFLSKMHPFALQQTMVRSTAFQKGELIDWLQHFLVTDVALKSTSVPQGAVMEGLILRLCQPG